MDSRRLDSQLPSELLAFLASVKYIGSFEEPVYLELVKHTQTEKARRGALARLPHGLLTPCSWRDVRALPASWLARCG